MDEQVKYAKDPTTGKVGSGAQIPKGWTPISKADYDSAPASQPAVAPPQDQAKDQQQGGNQGPDASGYFMRGVNPLHQTPPDVKSQSKFGKVGNFLNDTMNTREATDLIKSGQIGKGVSLLAGTVAGNWLGTGLMKLGGMEMKAAFASKETPEMLRSAMDFGRSLKAKLPAGIGISGTAWNKALRYVEPLRNVLDEKFDAMHNVLNNIMGATSPQFQQDVKKLASKGDPMIKNLAADLSQKTKNQMGNTISSPRTAMDYKEAEMWKRRLYNMAGNSKLEGFKDDLIRMAEELETQVQGIAQSQGLGQQRTELKNMYKQLSDIGIGTAATTEVKASAGRKLAATAAGAGAGIMIDPSAAALGGFTAERAAASTRYVLHSGVKQEADALAKKLGVNLSEEMFKGAPLSYKAGDWADRGSASMFPAMRAGTVANTPSQQ